MRHSMARFRAVCSLSLAVLALGVMPQSLMALCYFSIKSL